MSQPRKIKLIARKLSFAEAEEADIDYYAGIDWKESAANVERMRKNIWSEAYRHKREKIIKKTKLKEDRDDFE